MFNYHTCQNLFQKKAIRLISTRNERLKFPNNLQIKYPWSKINVENSILPIQFDKVVYLNKISLTRNWKKVYFEFKNFEGFEQPPKLYSIALNAMLKFGKFSEAEEICLNLIREFSKIGVSKSFITKNDAFILSVSIAKVFYKTGNKNSMDLLIKKIRSIDVEIPEQVAISYLKLFTSSFDLHQLTNFINDFHSVFNNPMTDIYSSFLMATYLNAGGLDKAFEVVNELLENKIKLGPYVFEVLLLAFSQKKILVEILVKIINIMAFFEIEMNFLMYSYIIKGMFDLKHYEAVVKWFNILKKNDISWMMRSSQTHKLIIISHLELEMYSDLTAILESIFPYGKVLIKLLDLSFLASKSIVISKWILEYILKSGQKNRFTYLSTNGLVPLLFTFRSQDLIEGYPYIIDLIIKTFSNIQKSHLIKLADFIKTTNPFLVPQSNQWISDLSNYEFGFNEDNSPLFENYLKEFQNFLINNQN